MPTSRRRQEEERAAGNIAGLNSRELQGLMASLLEAVTRQGNATTNPVSAPVTVPGPRPELPPGYEYDPNGRGIRRIRDREAREGRLSRDPYRGRYDFLRQPSPPPNPPNPPTETPPSRGGRLATPPVPKESTSRSSVDAIERRLSDLAQRRTGSTAEPPGLGSFNPPDNGRFPPDTGGWLGGYQPWGRNRPGVTIPQPPVGPLPPGSNNSTIVEDILGGPIGGGFTPAPAGIGAQVQSQIDPRLEAILRRMQGLQF